MLKIITCVIKKKEWQLSKKEHKLGEKENPSKELKLYRDLLDRLDQYKMGTDGLILRHYRYFTVKIDEPKGE